MKAADGTLSPGRNVRAGLGRAPAAAASRETSVERCGHDTGIAMGLLSEAEKSSVLLGASGCESCRSRGFWEAKRQIAGSVPVKGWRYVGLASWGCCRGLLSVSAEPGS